jgi:hypothetical protein
MDDNTSREAAKRAFRVAEFFLQEESRRRNAEKFQSRDQRPAPVQQPAEADTDESQTEEA